MLLRIERVSPGAIAVPFHDNMSVTYTPSDEDIRLRKQLLKVVLRNTLRKTGVPAQWIGGETKVLRDRSGSVKIELQLSLTRDESRFLTYLTSFQALFQRHLFAIEPGAAEWFSALSWQFISEPAFELPMPASDYWETVARDREITARQKGVLDWDKAALEHHFSETAPGDLVIDLSKTLPRRRVEDIAREDC